MLRALPPAPEAETGPGVWMWIILESSLWLLPAAPWRKARFSWVHRSEQNDVLPRETSIPSDWYAGGGGGGDALACFLRVKLLTKSLRTDDVLSEM